MTQKKSSIQIQLTTLHEMMRQLVALSGVYRKAETAITFIDCTMSQFFCAKMLNLP